MLKTADSDEASILAILLPDPEVEPTVDLWPTAGRALGIGRSKTYELADEDAFPVPVIRMGRSFRVPPAPLRRLLGLDGVASA